MVVLLDVATVLISVMKVVRISGSWGKDLMQTFEALGYTRQHPVRKSINDRFEYVIESNLKIRKDIAREDELHFADRY